MEETYPKAYLRELAHKWKKGNLTIQEEKDLEKWYGSHQDDVLELPPELSGYPDLIKDRITENVLSRINQQPVVQTAKMFRSWPRIAIAAAVSTIIFGAGVFYFHSQAEKTQRQVTSYVNDVAPGKQGATLTLANGSKILINDALAGTIASQSGVKISKTSGGQIVYEITDSHSGALEYNTLATMQGEQTQVRLPDGSVVFLNAASSLKYPTSFAKQQTRRVSLTGEGYFEIAKDKVHPFIVQAAGQQVRVLGTHFNINSYQDESAVKTTLLEGSVSVSPLTAVSSSLQGTTQIRVLTPGQQAIFKDSSLAVENVNTNDIVAWKNGDFVFDHEDFESIVRKVEKWYDVEFVYPKGKYSKLTLSGTVSRSNPLSIVLGALQEAGKLKFKIEGRRVTVI